jgi:hypothetical protein
MAKVKTVRAVWVAAVLVAVFSGLLALYIYAPGDKAVPPTVETPADTLAQDSVFTND